MRYVGGRVRIGDGLLLLKHGGEAGLGGERVAGSGDGISLALMCDWVSSQRLPPRVWLASRTFSCDSLFSPSQLEELGMIFVILPLCHRLGLDPELHM